MSGKIPVERVYEYLEMMLRDKWGYIYGTSGQLWTQSKQNTTTNDMAQRYGSRWIGHMVTDCSGVMVYIWRQFGLKIPHGSSSMVRQGYIVDCGPDPHPGWAAIVDHTPDTPDNTHIGIVGRDGKTVYEAKGTQAGFTTSKVTDSKWSKFGRFKDVNYEEVEPVPSGKQVSYKAEVTTNKGSLNIRKGPGIDPNTGDLYEKIGSVRKGTIVDVWTECDNGWRFIDDDGDQGYVDGRYLTKVEGTKAPETSSVGSADSFPKGEASSAFPSGEGGAAAPEEVTRLRRADGTEIWIHGDWEVYKE